MAHTSRVALPGTMALLALLLAPATAEACRFPTLTAEQAVNSADIIFKGTVVAVEPVESKVLEAVAVYRVDRMLKGPWSEAFVVIVSPCWVLPEPGERHVIFARAENGRLVADRFAQNTYESDPRGRGQFDALLPGHETEAERNARLEEIVEMEGGVGPAP